MQTEAIAKVKTEMDSSNNPYIKFVGNFLLGHLEGNPEDAGKILNAERTIGKSLDEMRRVAEKRKVGNCAVLSDHEGFAIVLKYFQDDETKAATIPAPAAPVVSTKPPADPVEIDLNDPEFDFLL